MRATKKRRGRRETAGAAPPPRAATSNHWRWIALAAGAVLVLGGIVLALGIGLRAAAPKPTVPSAASVTPASGVPAAPSFIGAARCAACHPKETEAYRGSDHARAMEPATEQTVRGDFHGAQFSHRGVTSTFLRRDGKFLVRTDGPDGKPGEFEIAYTFGARPLQQYLVPLAGGRLQALGIAWDTRAKAEGGQRWFHLFAGEALAAPDPLHWTGREQTWNYQCAECHSTDLRKNYDAEKNRYETAWADVTVSCEACHGPGSAHMTWAERRPVGAPRAERGATGLPVRLDRGAGSWVVKDPARGIAEWNGAPRSTAQVDACARCHARRRPIAEPYQYGRPFLDTHAPALLEPGLYHADGQILGEVYEWGSFVQSRMHAAGVTCSDCHEPHGLGLRAPGNAVCAQCHVPARFDAPEHHRHQPGSAASACVSCHMPARTYMVVDPRRDHSFRVPRPDLWATLGTPNACSGCHRDRPPAWAAAQIVRWHGPTSPGRRPHFGSALDAGRRGLPDAPRALAALASDPVAEGRVEKSQPNIFSTDETADVGIEQSDAGRGGHRHRPGDALHRQDQQGHPGSEVRDTPAAGSPVILQLRPRDLRAGVGPRRERSARLTASPRRASRRPLAPA